MPLPLSTESPAAPSRQAGFEAAPFVYLRTPLLAYNTAGSLFAADWKARLLQLLLASETLRVAVYIASPSLAHELATWIESGSVTDRAARRILTYVLRASTRTTPFGMFAAIGRANIGETTTVSIASDLQTQTRPDMGWLSALLDGWKSDVIFRQGLHVRVNDALISRGGRYTVYHPSHVHRTNGEKPQLAYTAVSFKATDPVRFLQENLRGAISVAETASMLEERFGEDREECLRLLNVLWDGGFFIDELALDPSADPLTSTVTALRRIDGERAHAVESLARELASIDSVPLSQRSIDNYRDIEEFQKGIDPSREARLQTDATRLVSGTLGQRVFDDVAALMRVMLRWHPLAMKRYRERFLTRYEGTSREVPLLELVHPSLGLGIPDDLELARILPRDLIERRFALASQALLDGVAEVELDDASLDALLPPNDDATLGASFDLGFEILARSAADVDEGNYRIVGAPLVFAPLAGASLGRFAKALGESALDDLRTLAEKIEASHPDAVVAELVVTPSYARGLNVSIRPVQFPYQIRIGLMHESADPHVITPDDLVVGLDASGFYVRSLRLNKRVEVVQTHVQNTNELVPPLGRFLSLLAADGVIFPHQFDWGPAESLTFLPGLRCGRIIISKARWRFERSVLVNACSEAAAMQAFARRWRLPKYVQLLERDNVLPFDISTDIGRELLTDHVSGKREHTVYLQKLLPGPEDMWIEDEHGAKYRGEFVASFVCNSPRARLLPHMVPASRDERVRAPGSEWIYFKLYVERDDQDRVLVQELEPLLASLSLSGAITSWFYVRYADPADHIRLRLHRAAENFGDAFQRLFERFAYLVQDKVLADVSISSYDREVERYGGAEAMAICERIFSTDSSCVVSNLLEDLPVDDERRLAFAARTIAHVAVTCSRESEQSASLFLRYRRSGKMRADGRKIVQMIQAELRDAGEPSRLPLAEGIIELMELDGRGGLSRPFTEVIDSIIHMHCNRCGLNLESEERARAIARQALHSTEVVAAR
jgi:thiopeptide-type bacteriocin biosynthesis protein